MPERAARLKELRQIEKKLKARIDELSALYQVSQTIASSTDLDKLLSLIVDKVASAMNMDVCMIHLIDGPLAKLKASHGITGRLARLKKPIALQRSVMNRVAKTRKVLRVDSFSQHAGDVLCGTCRANNLHSLLIVPLVDRPSVMGFITICKSRYTYTKTDEEELTLFANQASMAIENARLIEEEKLSYLNTVRLLVSVIDAKDRGTENHSASVMELSTKIGLALHLPPERQSILKYASLLHDIGKVGIDLNILRKPGPLTAKEWAQMRTHPRIGADIIRKAGFLDELIPAILYHHVRYNGGGYPATKKKREMLPIEARILSVADAYESMTSDRSYRKHLSTDVALAELKRYSGTQFDPKVVRALLRCLKK